MAAYKYFSFWFLLVALGLSGIYWWTTGLFTALKVFLGIGFIGQAVLLWSYRRTLAKAWRGRGGRL